MPSPFPFEGALTYGPGWPVALEAQERADALRSAMREEYAGASNEAMADALEAVLGSMSPAEAFNFSQALDRIGKGAGQLAKDPTFRQVVSTAAPILLQAAGTAVGGPAAGAIAARFTRVLAAIRLPKIF